MTYQEFKDGLLFCATLFALGMALGGFFWVLFGWLNRRAVRDYEATYQDFKAKMEALEAEDKTRPKVAEKDGYGIMVSFNDYGLGPGLTLVLFKNNKPVASQFKTEAEFKAMVNEFEVKTNTEVEQPSMV